MMEGILPEIEGERASVAELALMMAYLEILAALRPFPPREEKIRAKYFLSLSLEAVAKIAEQSYALTVKDLLKWQADHKKTMSASLGLPARLM